MKSQFPFFGVQSPVRKLIFKEIQLRVKNEKLSIDEILSLVESLWKYEERECQYICIELLKWKHKHLKINHLGQIENLIITKSWWDTVDLLATNSIGFILSQDKSLQYQVTKKWIYSSNIWLIRTAIIHQLKYGIATDGELLYALIKMQIGSKEFFINKASGWALRQYSKINPESVKNFISMNPNLDKLTIREGGKYL